jgi:hypothetical protein
VIAYAVRANRIWLISSAANTLASTTVKLLISLVFLPISKMYQIPLKTRK